MVVAYDPKKFDFRGYFETLFGMKDLEHLESASYSGTGLQDIETDLHKKFYTVIPHKNDHPILTDTQIYVKRALLIKQIKGY